MKERQPASLTVEAALVLPVFLFAMILLSHLGLLIKCQDEMQWAMTRVAREASAEYGASESKMLESSAYYRTKLSTYMGDAGLPISLSESKLLKDGEEIDLIVRYQVTLPFRLGSIGRCQFRQRVHTRAFIGVESRGGETDSKDIIVYVTETGRVYHKTRECTYLKLSISQMKYMDIAVLRNESGGKYKPCERCCEGKALTSESPVWITNYGDRYHDTRSCSGIKRSIREIKLSEAGSRTPCSKCGK
ncbi:MAG: pilus assembly protein [Lachnospiraceae bacterium]|nr:pilus assembly protein [Lachnospiraceae bacterium]